MKPKLKTIILDIDGIDSERKYRILRKDFEQKDILFQDIVNNETDDDGKGAIPLRVKKEYLGEEFEYEFIEDYFIPSINEMKIRYIENIEEELNKIYGSDAKLDFLLSKIQEVTSFNNIYDQVSYLGKLEKNATNKVLLEIEDILSEKKENVTIKIENKLNFNLSLGELTHLLKLFHENKIITGISISDLMHFAETNFKYKNNDVNRAGKQLNSYTKRKGITKYDQSELLMFFKNKLGN